MLLLLRAERHGRPWRAPSVTPWLHGRAPDSRAIGRQITHYGTVAAHDYERYSGAQTGGYFGPGNSAVCHGCVCLCRHEEGVGPGSSAISCRASHARVRHVCPASVGITTMTGLDRAGIARQVLQGPGPGEPRLGVTWPQPLQMGLRWILPGPSWLVPASGLSPRRSSARHELAASGRRQARWYCPAAAAATTAITSAPRTMACSD